MQRTKPIRLIVAEDSPILQEKMRNLFVAEQHMELVEVISTGAEAIDSIIAHQPDVVLMDINMESTYAGIKAMQQIKGQYPAIKVIMLTVFDDEDTIMRAFEHGADDYILKDFEPVELLYAVEAAYYDRSTINPKVAKKLKKEIVRIRKDKGQLQHILRIITSLTPTEFRIIEQLMEHKKIKEIASTLCIEPSTVKTHINHLLKKFNMRKSSEVTTFIRETCLLDFFQSRMSL